MTFEHCPPSGPNRARSPCEPRVDMLSRQGRLLCNTTQWVLLYSRFWIRVRIEACATAHMLGGGGSGLLGKSLHAINHHVLLRRRGHRGWHPGRAAEQLPRDSEKCPTGLCRKPRPALHSS